jgi:putative Holliday junction resolvase
MGRVIGIDFGLKRTGLALSDPSEIIASGLKTVDSRELMKVLIELVQKENVEAIALGEPKRLNNEASHITVNVHLLKEALENQFPLIKIVLIDERFTSKMAFQAMIDGGVKKKDRQNKATVDMVSATIILQSYLDHQ